METENSEKSDLWLNCVDCQEEFVVDSGEQAWFEAKGFSIPKRCKPCRKKKKEERERGGNFRR